MKDFGDKLEKLEIIGDTPSELAEDFNKLCNEIIEATRGPRAAVLKITEQAAEAIADFVPMGDEEKKRVQKIMMNVFGLLVGVYVKGGALTINKASSMDDPDEEGVKASKEFVEALESELKGATHDKPKRKETIH